MTCIFRQNPDKIRCVEVVNDRRDRRGEAEVIERHDRREEAERGPGKEIDDSSEFPSLDQPRNDAGALVAKPLIRTEGKLKRSAVPDDVCTIISKKPLVEAAVSSIPIRVQ